MLGAVRQGLTGKQSQRQQLHESQSELSKVVKWQEQIDVQLEKVIEDIEAKQAELDALFDQAETIRESKQAVALDV